MKDSPLTVSAALNDSQQAQQFENKLTFVLTIVNDWLKFAEAKNGGLLAFGGVCIFGLANILTSNANLSTPLIIGIMAGIGCLALSCFLSTLSFLPKVRRIEYLLGTESGECSEKDNLLYFADLCKYDPKQLIEAMGRRYFPEALPPESSFVLLDIADQILNNSRITHRKYKFFQASLLLMLLSVPVLLLVWLATAILFFSYSQLVGEFREYEVWHPIVLAEVSSSFAKGSRNSISGMGKRRD